ncbi:uncharacterized protein LOC113329106 [Papaver somniferum]|uniref:uncharacterized protein LOC113329106 n=1 Tax=Papaver somniferum TaxID=3469 RepID=UPI000E700C68|nr:uncharacterized protein LOC113329106 [Papaver somniferum]
MKIPRQQQEDAFPNGELLREIAELRELVSRGKDGGKRQLEEAIKEAAGTPFARQIQLITIPRKCTLPKFPSVFDGSTCAIHHIKTYSLALLQYENNDAVLCKYFPASLAGEALKWFDGFHEGSINLFEKLQILFLGQYMSSSMKKHGIEKSFSLRRRINESLRDMTNRWRTLSNEMAGRVDERNLILSFINALFPTDLLFTQIFKIKDRITMTELREY